MHQYKNRRGLWIIPGQGGVRVEVEVIDVRTRYGGLDFLIMPVAGQGTRWVAQAAVDLKAPVTA